MFVGSEINYHFDRREKSSWFKNYNFTKISRSARNDTVFLYYLFMITLYHLILSQHIKGTKLKLQL